MAWTPEQIKLAHIARTQIQMSDEHYRIVLQNVAGVRRQNGDVSSKNASAGMLGFRRFMAFCEQSGFVDRVHPAGYWRDQAAQESPALKAKIVQFHAAGVRGGIWDQESLPAFVERQTRGRMQGGTTSLDECDAIDLYKILEGLKGWGYREARKNNVNLDAA